MQNKIHEAAGWCLSHCLDTCAPFSMAALFIDQIARHPDWTPSEVRELRELITRIMGRPNWDDESFDRPEISAAPDFASTDGMPPRGLVA
jgi:hypothetical protein